MIAFPPLDTNVSESCTFPPFEGGSSSSSSIFYDGSLLPVGTGVDPTNRYLKDLGVDKNHVVVESGQGKLFNGTNQYIATSIVPNPTEGTLIVRFTYGGGDSRLAIGQSDGNNFMIGIDVYGKIYARIGASSLFADQRDLVSGRSYFVAVKWTGVAVKVYIDADYVGSFNMDYPMTTFPLSLGARRTATTPDLFFDSVISEVYYYDIAITDAQILSLYQYPEKITINTAGGIVPDIGSVDNCKIFLPMCESDNTLADVYNIAITPATKLSIANFTSACVNSARQLSYGAQCIAWNRDALGIPLGMSGGLSFDAGKSVKFVDTQFISSDAAPFVLEAILPYATGGNPTVGGGFDTYRLIRAGSSAYAQYDQTAGGGFLWSTTAPYTHIVLNYNGSGTATGYLDGVGKPSVSGLTSPATRCLIGITDGANSLGIIAGIKIYKDAQYSNFDIAKSWADAQTVIAGLPIL
jgi:hypothetical protein